MTIDDALNSYNALKVYFAPEYHKNNQVLSEFKNANQKLTSLHVSHLIDILRNSSKETDKYFVADLLYLYNSFDQKLLEPLINSAIQHKDVSFNRVFLKPCINVFGIEKVVNMLELKFKVGDVLTRICISNLAYWIRPEHSNQLDSLKAVIIHHAYNSTNIVELYHYKLLYSDLLRSLQVPYNAFELTQAVKGNHELEDLLYNKLQWAKDA